MKFRFRYLARALVVGLGLLFVFSVSLAPQARAASSIVVNDLGDDMTAGNHKCTLREAINNANANGDTTIGDCATGNSGADTVTFSVSGTIKLTSTLPAINDNLTIDGNGHSITVSGNNAVQVMVVSSGKTLSLLNLTVANGGANAGYGGGVYSNGTLNVTGSTFSDNGASQGGGGIYNNGTLNVTNSTFFGNSAPYGGGIFNDGSAIITNGTFSGNFASSGGGIYNDSGSTTLRNTIIANSTSGGNCGVNNGNIADGGHNLQFGGSVAISCGATIPTHDPVLSALANNGGPTQTMALQSGSWAIDTGDNTVCAALPVNHLDQRGVTRPQGTDCDIGAYERETPLAGPDYIVTLTADSDSGVCGAVYCTLREAVNAANAHSGADTITFSVDGTITLGSTLPAIADDLTMDGSGHSITISGNNKVQVMAVNSAKTLSLLDLTVADGNCAGCNGAGVNNSGTLDVTNSTFSSNSGNWGGGVRNNSGATLNVTNSTFSANHAATYGGAINDDGGTVNVTGSTFVSNTGGSDDGGGILNGGTGGAVNVVNSTFSGNSAGRWGGGILNGGTLTVTNSTFWGNGATSGGGIYNYSGTTTLKNTIVADSTSGGNCGIDTGNIGSIADGGNDQSYPDTTCPGINQDPKLAALANNGGPTQTMALQPGSAAIDAGDNTACAAAPVNNLDQRGITRPQGTHCDIGAFEVKAQTGSSFVVNTNADPGDPVCADLSEGDCSLRAAINAANAHSGADTITFSASGPITLTATLPAIAEDLSIDGSGHSIIVSGDNAVQVMVINSGKTLSLLNLTIANAWCTNCMGGGANNSGTLNVTNSTFSGNSASVGAGVRNNSGATLNVTNSTFATNHSSGYGAAINNDSGMVNVTGSTFVSNTTTTDDGGGILNGGTGGTVNVDNSTFSGNSAGRWGGGILNGGTLNVTNSTFSGNFASSGGNIYNYSGATTITNTVVANSTSAGNCFVNAGNIADGGHNLQFGGSIANSCGATIPTSDPKLITLANNGGPTQTMALGAGSPAINTANASSCPAADQRGYSRRSGFCDIGAYEAQPASLVTYAGSGQSTAIHSAFPTPLQALAKDGNDNVLGGVVVTFAGPATGPGIVAGGTETTNGSGIAGFSATANGVAGGPYTVTATSGSLTASFTLTNQAMPTWHLFLPLIQRNN